MKSNLITRYAPSPTGTWHLGQARTALFTYLLARHSRGKMILRIDDTDVERSRKEYENEILENLSWLSITHDELYRQSERRDFYRACLEKMMANGSAYLSQEEPKEEGQRAEVIRFKNPNKDITFIDLIRGDITFNTTELGDFVVAKDMETPLYHLASVADDVDMGITHLIRGEDHISNTPRQILLFEALGATPPHFAHIPLVLAPDKSKMSKRKGAKSVSAYKAEGYLPEAVINYTALLGWSPQAKASGGLNQEIFSLNELTSHFDIQAIQKSGAIFNEDKLRWFNHEYIKQLGKDTQVEKVEQYLPGSIKQLPTYNQEIIERLLPVLIERISTFGEITQQADNGELDYFFIMPSYDKSTLKTQEHLPALREMITALPEDNFTPETIKQTVWDYATEKGRGEVLWPMRVALSGKEKSPDPFIISYVLGKAETLRRLEHAEKL